MKKFYFVLLLLFPLILKGQCDCPDKGDSKQKRIQVLDSLKNRKIDTNIIISSVQLKDILSDGNDLERFSDSEYVCITGWVIESKDGGLETSTCHSKKLIDHDIHLVVALSDTSTPKQSMICEITRKYRYNHPDVGVHTYDNKHVKIYGFIFYDMEHKQNAVNTSPNGTTLWRKTIVEIHPVCKIEIIK